MAPPTTLVRLCWGTGDVGIMNQHCCRAGVRNRPPRISLQQWPFRRECFPGAGVRRLDIWGYRGCGAAGALKELFFFGAADRAGGKDGAGSVVGAEPEGCV